MHKNYIKISLNALFIFACVFFHGCKDQDAVTPHEEQVTENNDILQKIKSLGFAENQIKETPNYYLADGDLYFSKKISSNATAPGKKSGRRIFEKYATLTIHVDESLTGVMDEHWRTGIDQAIAEWNADKQVHFHFALTNSTDANINIIQDTDLPNDVAIASEFPKDGRTGSSIRINVAATTAVQDPKQAFAHALEHSVGFLHSTSVKNKGVKINSSAAKAAAGPRYIWELYAIQGDVLYRIDALTGTYYALTTGWTGTEAMGQLDGLLYMVQFGTLWAVNPSDGSWTGLTDGWEGSQHITGLFPESKLFIMQNSWIYPVDPGTGSWGASLGSYTLPRGMIAITDSDNNNRLAVLRRKPGSSTVSLFYLINPSDGAVHSSTTIKASGAAGWNKNFLLTGDPFNTQSMVVFNGKINFPNVNIGGYSFYTDSSWPDAELATCIGLDVFLINKGTLYRVDWFSNSVPHPMLGVGGAKRLGKLNDWVDTSFLVFLEE